MKTIRYLLSIPVVLAAIFFIPGQFAGEYSFSKVYSLEKPPAVAFGNLLNPFHFKQWIPGYKSIHSVSGAMTTSGSINRLVLDRKGKEVSVMQMIEKIDPIREFSAEYEYKSWQLRNTILISPAESGSSMQVEASLHSSGLVSRALLFWIRGRVGSELDSMFTDLAGLINSGISVNPFLGSSGLNKDGGSGV